MFDCSIRGERNVTLIYPSGELDLASIAAFREALRNSRKANQNLIIDMSQLHYIDSGAIHLLLFYRDIVRQSGRWLALVHVPAEVRRILKIVDRRNSLAIFSSTEIAFQSMNTNKLTRTGPTTHIPGTQRQPV
jgi:anti-anti-sigma factor